jgi:uncharacterized protein YodC (DUF2158 family)
MRMLQTISWPAIAAAIIAAATGCTDSSTEGEEPDVDDQALVSSPTGVVANCVGVRCTADENVDEQPIVYAAPPATVTSLTSLATAMRLAFTVPSGVSTISIYRMDKTTEGFWRRHSSVPVNPTGSYSYDDAGAILGREYCYSVGTLASGDTRVTMSNSLCAFHSGGTLPPPPAAPTDVAIANTYERGLRLRFTDASTDETSFVVERNVFGSWVQERTLPAETGTGTVVRFLQSDLDSEQRYCYRIKAVNANGSSAPVQTCGRTNPLAVVDPVYQGGPEMITIEHPATGSLRVRWLDGDATSQWVVKTFDGLTGSELGSASVEDHRSPPLTHQTLTLTGLTPGKLYCFTVGRGSAARPVKLCEVPFAARTAVEHRDPRPEVTPYIVGLTTPRNGRIRISLGQQQPGQIIERIASSNSVRRTLRVDANGGATIDDDTVTPGQTYCYRPWVFNDYGSRYGAIQCVLASAYEPSRPMNLRVTSQEGRDLTLAWDSSANSTSYDFKWFGERQSYTDHDGDKNVSGTSTSFRGYEGFEYCFSVRGKNQFGTSSWTEICGIDIADDGIVSYGASLAQVVAGSVTYGHLVSPGGGAAFLTNVFVAGNGFTPYVVRFIASGNCESNTTGGILVEPGENLTGADLNTLYGATQPQAPVQLIGCKMWRGSGESNLDSMPIQVTYRR